MKELNLNEMEAVSGAGILDVPCALVSYTVQSALGLVKVGVETAAAVALNTVQTAINIGINSASSNPESIFSVIQNSCNSLNYTTSGIWSDFVYNAATDWGQVSYAMNK